MNDSVASAADARREFWAWFVQRASGAALAVFVLIHLVTMMIAVRGGLSAAEILGRVGSHGAWHGFYLAFVVCAAVHAPLGIRNIVREHGRLSASAANALAWLLGSVLLALGGYAVWALNVAATRLAS